MSDWQSFWGDPGKPEQNTLYDKAALAREAHSSHARDHVGEASRNRKRRVLKRVGDEAPMQP